MDVIRQAALDIDAYFDELLVDGMSTEHAEQVEDMRRQAHEEFRLQMIQRARAFPQPEIPAPRSSDPIQRIF